MKKLLFVIIAFACSFALYQYLNPNKHTGTPLPREAPRKPLLAYTFNNLKTARFEESAIVLGKETGETDTTRSQLFQFRAPSVPGGKPDLRVTGLMNIPKKEGTYPVVIMLRGFVPEEIYESGIGTQRVAESLARDGYITLAPDFLGFGGSDKPSTDPFEARFQTYTTALSLLASLGSLESALEASYSGILADTANVGIWGHSNGGHIALSILAITGREYPAVLWAPVSKSFPYSILYYTDEAEDQGKAMRKVLASFENDYDCSLYSPERYYDWIRSPLSVQQGTADREVPVYWSDDLKEDLESQGVAVSYDIHAGADHNLVPSWPDAVANTKAFFKNHLSDNR
jgi:dienelactone hydrolase